MQTLQNPRGLEKVGTLQDHVATSYYFWIIGFILFNDGNFRSLHL